jgi:hypothetical protein
MRMKNGSAAVRSFVAIGLAGVIGASVVCAATFAETSAAIASSAQPAPASSTQPATGSSPPASTSSAPAPALELTGFRSALFGMSETDVRAAIAKDFGATIAIKSSQNGAEHTEVLTMSAPDVLPEGGTAEVSYVFGYKTKKLIQVGVLWSREIDDKMTPEKLVSNADTLRAYFMTAGYKPDTIAENAPVANGVLMFRGSDASGHTTILLLHGVAGEKPPRAFSPTAVSLFYLADVKNPDVYRVQPGKF